MGQVMRGRLKPLDAHARVFRSGIAKPRTVVLNPASLMPRFWATAWFAYKAGKSWSATVEEAHCRGLFAFYEHCDARFGAGSLDAVLSDFDDAKLCDMVRTFHGRLSGEKNISTTTVRCWDTVRLFVSDILEIFSKNSCFDYATARFLEATGRMRQKVSKRVVSARALPSSTMHEVCQILDPDSHLNPRADPVVRLRNWLILHLFFRAGLRRGELLLLRVDSLFADVDKTGKVIHWISVQTLEEEDEFYEVDQRHSAPSLKNVEAFREVPADDELVAQWQEYLLVRPDGPTAFLFTANGQNGLSKESLDRLFQDVTRRLTPRALKAFRWRTKKKYVSCHDFRHTCATVAYAHFQRTEDRDTTFSRMRAFFGWAPESDMPAHYSRVAVKDDLIKNWDITFAKQLATLREYQ